MITFIITGLMAIGFMSFGGMLTGGDDSAKKDEKVVVVKAKDVKKEIANNTKVVK